MNNAWNRILKWAQENSITDRDDYVLENINEIMINIQMCQVCDVDNMKEGLIYDYNDHDF